MTGNKETITILIEGLDGNEIQKEYCSLALSKLELAGYDVYKFSKNSEDVFKKIQDGLALSEKRMFKYALNNLFIIIMVTIFIVIFSYYYFEMSYLYLTALAFIVFILNMFFRRGYNHILFLRRSNRLYKKNVDKKILDIQ